MTTLRGMIAASGCAFCWTTSAPAPTTAFCSRSVRIPTSKYGCSIPIGGTTHHEQLTLGQ